MQPRKLRIGGYKDYPPQVTFEDCKDWSLKRCNHPGSDAELLQIVLKLANIDYELVHQNIDDTDEILGLIENGSLDMSIMALRMIEKRYDHVLFTTPINFLKYGYLVKEVEKLESDDFLLHTFRPEIYLLIIASLLVTALAIRFICHSDSAFHTWCWRLFILFFNQDHFFFRPKVTTIFIGGGWIVFGFLMVTYYQSKMKSFLTVPLREGTPFDTLNNVLNAMEAKEWTGVVTPKGYSPETHAAGTTLCDRVKRLYSEMRVISLNTNDEDVLLDFLTKGKYVGFTAYTTDIAIYDVNIIDKERKIIFIEDRTIALEMLAFAVNKDFIYELELINRSLDVLISSHGTIVRRYNATYRPFGRSVPVTSDSRITISMIHLHTFLIAFVAAIGLSILAFGVEHFIYRCTWRKYTPRLGALGFARSRSTNIGVFRRPQMIVLSTKSTYNKRDFMMNT